MIVYLKMEVENLCCSFDTFLIEFCRDNLVEFCHHKIWVTTKYYLHMWDSRSFSLQILILFYYKNGHSHFRWQWDYHSYFKTWENRGSHTFSEVGEWVLGEWGKRGASRIASRRRKVWHPFLVLGEWFSENGGCKLPFADILPGTC
jgi:hypothetical protein